MLSCVGVDINYCNLVRLNLLYGELQPTILIKSRVFLVDVKLGLVSNYLNSAIILRVPRFFVT